ncbi:hypothetical protein [Streptococcus oralis]|jgi:hypothetical protein|uniref:hypothetical protein n=1 Tax=Streptococcus oralis TaxID=1303 RepID=UPI00232B6346|nr:hypothetical protein [Streptococcus oralis]MDB6209289.1 hypothetical protein [Streptococcus oralis]
MKINTQRIKDQANSALNITMKISKSVGKSMSKGGSQCLNFIVNNPEFILIILSLITNKNSLNQRRINELEDTEQDRSLDDSTFSELLQEEQAINHFYPDERKFPCVHLYHLGENTFVRGGTELEKEEFRKENNL